MVVREFSKMFAIACHGREQRGYELFVRTRTARTRTVFLDTNCFFGHELFFWTRTVLANTNCFGEHELFWRTQILLNYFLYYSFIRRLLIGVINRPNRVLDSQRIDMILHFVTIPTHFMYNFFLFFAECFRDRLRGGDGPTVYTYMLG